MARRIEIFDTTLRDGNKLPFAVLSTTDRVRLALQLERLGVDVIEAGFPAASREEAECVSRVSDEVKGPRVAALARAIEGDVQKALACLKRAVRPHLHVFMSVSPQFITRVLRTNEQQALKNLDACIRIARTESARVQFSLSEAPHARPEFLREAILVARDAGAEVISLADTNGIMVPEGLALLVEEVRGIIGSNEEGAPIVGVHCHDDLGLATANTLAAIRAGAGHVEVTVGGFGERAGNAALEEVAFLISAFGDRYDVCHGIHLEEISRTARLFDSLTGVRTHPNKAIIGQCAFVPAEGGFPGGSVDPAMRALLQESTIGRSSEDARDAGLSAPASGPYELQAFNVLTGSHAPPVGLVVILRDGKTLTQTSHGKGPIDALFHAVDKALGFSTRMVLYSVSTLAAGTEALTEVIVTVELRGRRFHGRHTSTDVIEASLRAYLSACNAIGESGILDGPSDFHVAGEYLWE
jgi:2-isopropylmalate synthase